uniref:Large ribosomal subunit protein bL35m n=1 Tax=Clastoptera arizonana TaxID=38151 RepID=A0A1B6E860_9HEMI
MLSLLRSCRNIVSQQMVSSFLPTQNGPAKILSSYALKNNSIFQIYKCFSVLNLNNRETVFCSTPRINNPLYCGDLFPNLSNNLNLVKIPKRTVTKFSLRKGKRKSVKVVLRKFKRLDWGIWIHGKCGRQKKLYKKSAQCKKRLRQHVFCNATQSRLLDKMVTSYWRKPKHYIDDPYEPYHSREEFRYTRINPLPPHS